MQRVTLIVGLIGAIAVGWYGRGYYEASRYVDGPCFVSGFRSNPAEGRIVVDCVMGDVTYGPAHVTSGDVVRTAIDDPYDTSYVQATIWIEGEPIGASRREWLYDVKNVIEAVKGREQIQPAGGCAGPLCTAKFGVALALGLRVSRSLAAAKAS